MLERFSSSLHLQDLSVLALVDILVLAVIIYQLLLIIRGTRSVNILLAMAALAICYVLTGPGLLQLKALHSILGMLLLYVPLAVVVLFQTQIRRALANLGKNPFNALIQRDSLDDIIEEVSLAAASMGSKRTGALIVIERDMGLRTFHETGIGLDALVTYDLLLNIFTRRSPLHDGAVIIADGRIKAASCYLPLTTAPSLSRTYGTRHRAALGISQESDALAIVVSEERGVVSLCENGTIVENLDARSLAQRLREGLTARPPGRGRLHTAARSLVAGSSDA